MDGGLPPAPTLSVSGERELVPELERIIDALNKGAAVDWEKRSVLTSSTMDCANAAFTVSGHAAHCPVLLGNTACQALAERYVL